MNPRERLTEDVEEILMANQDDWGEAATAVLNWLLPQVTTVEELEALPLGTWLMADGPRFLRRTIFSPASGGVSAVWYSGVEYSVETACARYGPLTVVYRPQPDPSDR